MSDWLSAALRPHPFPMHSGEPTETTWRRPWTLVALFAALGLASVAALHHQARTLATAKAGKPVRLSAVAAKAIDDPASILHVSHASLGEITLKYAAGKLNVPEPPRQWWAEQVRQWRVIEIHLTGRGVAERQ